MSLLEKFRELEALLKKESLGVKELVDFISKTISCNTYLINAEGVILGSSLPNGPDCTKSKDSELLTLKLDFKQRIGFIFQTAANLPLETCFLNEENCFTPNTFMTIVPIRNVRSTSGHLLLTKKGKMFDEEELVLVEAASLLACIYSYEGIFADNASGAQPLTNVDMVLDSLSFSEIKAISNVFKELDGNEGFLVASKIADRIGISRSVIVNAMRKLESAGIVNSRSLGIKGTYIKVKNTYFLEALKAKVK